MIRYATLLAFGMPTLLLAQSESRSLPPDRSKPVSAKSEIIAAWQKRQSALNSFRFTWTEEQVHPKGWLANPRYPERERLAIPDLLIDRAVTNERRQFYRGRSIFLLEERHDPSGWKTIVWLEPERGFLVSRYLLAFEQKTIADIVIDYTQDPRWGWIPAGWRVTEMLSDGSKRQVTVARVTSYSINVPIAAEEFR